MRVQIRQAPWHKEEPNEDLQEALSLLGKDTWRNGAIEFYAKRAAAERFGGRAPKGIQRHLNQAVDEVFTTSGWAGEDGRYRKDDAWVRITFRHQMSLGADILDAYRMHKKEGVEHTAILAAGHEFLKAISPNDHNAMCSFEKFNAQLMELDGCFDFPLFLGRLEPKSVLPKEIGAALLKPRSRG